MFFSQPSSARQLIFPSLEIHALESYQEHLDSAHLLLASRDPDDAHPLALARVLSLPIWSNDADLANVGVDCYTTARLLKVLQGQTEDRA